MIAKVLAIYRIQTVSAFAKLGNNDSFTKPAISSEDLDKIRELSRAIHRDVAIQNRDKDGMIIDMSIQAVTMPRTGSLERTRPGSVGRSRRGSIAGSVHEIEEEIELAQKGRERISLDEGGRNGRGKYKRRSLNSEAAYLSEVMKKQLLKMKVEILGEMKAMMKQTKESLTGAPSGFTIDSLDQPIEGDDAEAGMGRGATDAAGGTNYGLLDKASAGISEGDLAEDLSQGQSD